MSTHLNISYIHQQIEHDFINLTKLVSQFLDIYTILHELYEPSLEMKLESYYLFLEKRKMAFTAERSKWLVGGVNSLLKISTTTLSKPVRQIWGEASDALAY